MSVVTDNHSACDKRPPLFNFERPPRMKWRYWSYPALAETIATVFEVEEKQLNIVAKRKKPTRQMCNPRSFSRGFRTLGEIGQAQPFWRSSIHFLVTT
jgi:hypothetical protein